MPHNVQKIANVLPNLPEDLPVVKLQCEGKSEKSRDFKVRRRKVLDALLWLVENNRAYADITLDYTRIENLPEDGTVETTVLKIDVPQDPTHVDTGPSNDDESDKLNIETNS